MPIAFACPACKKGYQVPDQCAGRTSKCRDCGAAFQIPAASAPTFAPVGGPAVAAAPTFALVDGPDASAGVGRKKIIILASAALVGLFLVAGMGLAAWYLLGSSSSSRFTRYLPDDCVGMVSIQVGDLQTGAAWDEINREFPEASRSLDHLEKEVGIAKNNIDQVVMGIPAAEISASRTAAGMIDRPQTIAIVKTRQAVTADGIKSLQNQDSHGGQQFKEVTVGAYTLFEGESIMARFSFDPNKKVERERYDGTGYSFCVVSSTLVIYGRGKDLKALLERDKNPELSDAMQAALKDTDLSATVAFAFAPKSAVDVNALGIPRVFPKLADSLVRMSGQVDVGRNTSASVEVVCKDEQSATDLRKMVDGVLAGANLRAPSEARDLLGAIKLNSSGSTVTGRLDARTANAVKGYKELGRIR